MSLQKFRLFYPVNITLFHGESEDPNIEPYFTKGISPHYIHEVNRVILKHPLTNAGGNGLLKYFSCEDETISFYVKSKISNAQPQITYYTDAKLYGMVIYTVDSDSPLPKRVVDALKADLRRQLTEGWGINEFEISINDGILYFRDRMYHLDWKPNDSIVCGDAEFEELHGATLNVRVCKNDLSFIVTLDELKNAFQV